MANTPQQLLEELLLFIESAPTSHSRESLSKYLHEDIRWTFPVGCPPGVCGIHKGIGAVSDLLVQIFTEIYNADRFKYEFNEFFGNDEFAAARYRVIAEFANGSTYENDYALMARVREGKISELWEFLDTLSASQQFESSNIS
jgi:hypothetical protein